MRLQAHGPGNLLSAAGALDTARERAVAEAVQKAVTAGTTVPSMASTLPPPAGEGHGMASSLATFDSSEFKFSDGWD